MTHYYDSQTYIAASARLDEACSWFSRLGIKTSPTRIGRYQKIFSALAKYQENNTIEKFFENYTLTSFVNAAHEVAELVRIYEGLNEHQDASLVERLRDSLKGHELFVMDDKDRSGRDFSLELAIASKFSRAGLPVDFGHQADLRTAFSGREVFVECKRLKSSAQVKRRIKEGLTQLETRYAQSKEPTNARGLLILSIAKLINAELGVLEAQSHKHLGDLAFAYTRSLIEHHRALWQAEVDQRTLGVAVVLDVPGLVGKTKKLVTCHQVAMNNCGPIESPNYLLLEELSYHVFPRQT